MIVYGTQLSVIPFRWYTIIFVTTDIICLVLQAGGAGWTQAPDITPDNLERAINVLRAGLGMQVASVSIFLVLSADFAYRVLRKRDMWSTRFADVRENKKFKPMMIGKSVKFLIQIVCNIISATVLILCCRFFHCCCPHFSPFGIPYPGAEPGFRTTGG